VKNVVIMIIIIIIEKKTCLGRKVKVKKRGRRMRIVSTYAEFENDNDSENGPDGILA